MEVKTSLSNEPLALPDAATLLSWVNAEPEPTTSSKKKHHEQRLSRAWQLGFGLLQVMSNGTWNENWTNLAKTLEEQSYACGSEDLQRGLERIATTCLQTTATPDIRPKVLKNWWYKAVTEQIETLEKTLGQVRLSRYGKAPLRLLLKKNAKRRWMLDSRGLLEEQARLV